MSDQLNAWRDLTNTAISEALGATEAAVAPVGPPARELLDPFASAAAGGKRLRALLTFASHRAQDGDDEAQVAQIAAAIELFQTAALLHDDVLDGSDTRRGQPAAHRRIESLHREAGWEGDSEHYGVAGAVLAGDIALMACNRAMSRVTGSHSAGPVLANLFATMAELVTAGQYADMRAAVQPLDSLGDQREQILTVMRTKTASYSAQYPLMLGAAAAGAPSSRLESLSQGGIDLGLAFQLRDDVLGLTGTPEVTGKPAGDDIREGKRTLLLWHAWTHGSGADREALRSVLGDRNASDQHVADAVEVIVGTGAIDSAEEQIRALSQRADRELTRGDLKSDGVTALRALASAVVDRNA
ncbi:polyprenyl synthetase family protein [Demequina flava]|uniref:polyprenyl synthetase family protein n=1 Tax=Demequina flava TaxID=1095025 RepID=UPI0007811F3A|nr:polyprenyl synthetase family protein [Demequina flava]